jgi:hypothetical protein
VFPARRGVSSVPGMMPTVAPVLPAAPLINPALVQSAEEAIGQNVLQAATSAPASTGRWFSGWSRPSWEETKSFVQGYTPSMETVKATPANLWGGITSRAGSIYESRPKTMEEAGQMASALPGQALSVGQTGFAYPGRAVMSSGSAVGSGIGSVGSWLGSKWSSYAPQTAQQWAGQASKFVGENVWEPTAGAFSKYVSTPISQSSAADLLSKMTEEQKQAAVGLAAVIAAGLAAKKGYDVWRGPSAYSEFKQDIDRLIGQMLIEYTLLPRERLAQDIIGKISEFMHMINGALVAGTLSQPEADNLLQDLNTMKLQRVVIGDISKQIISFNKEIITLRRNDALLGKNDAFNKANHLYNKIIGKSPILTPEQKGILQKEVQNIYNQ